MIGGAKKIALVEMGGSHDECLYAQVRYLKSAGHRVELICNHSLKSNVDYFDGLDRVHFIELRTGLTQWVDLWRIRKLLVKGKFDRIVFNTAQGNVLKNLFLLPLPKKSLRFGVIHNLRKLGKSHSQKVITRHLKAYFVLSDYLIDRVDPEVRKTVKLQPLYTVFYPNYPKVDVAKLEHEIWICVPGQVERSRRDYDSLFDSIERYGVNKNVKFIFLGRCEHADGDGSYVKQRIAELGVTEQFMLWDSFIETELFYSILQQSDYILPLIHPDHESFSLYEYQISGAFNLAFGYKKPLLMERSFAELEDFKTNAIVYSVATMMEQMNALSTPDFQQFYQEEKWRFEYQRDGFLKVLGLE